MQLIEKTLTYTASQPGNVAYEISYYTRPSGFEKMRVQLQEIRDDIMDSGWRSFSNDNGLTWSEARPANPAEQTASGTRRAIESSGFVDPHNGLLLNLVLEGTLPEDNPMDGMSSYYLKYRVSGDGGHTYLHEENLVQHGPEFDSSHPIEYVHVGKNALMNGAENSILRARQGHLVVATTITPLDDKGNLYNPGGGYTYHDVVILLGHWRSDASIEWELGPRLSLDPHLSTRGLLEPTMALLPDGRILMVMRGSNGGAKDPEFAVAGVKWFSVSSDGGHTWTSVKPWQFNDGETLYSPSSISQLVRHSNGKYYWFGNICKENARGNGPRYPVVALEVDPQTLLPKPETLFVVQGFDRQGPPTQQLSNFMAHEDRLTGDLLLHLTTYGEAAGVPSGDAYLYRLKVD